MFEVRRVEDCTFDGLIVRLEGNCDLAAGGLLEQKLTFLIAGHPRRVIFDLEALEFIGSFGIGQLVTFEKGVRRNSGRVAFARVPEGIHAALKFTRLTDVFDVHPTVAAAADALRAA